MLIHRGETKAQIERQLVAQYGAVGAGQAPGPRLLAAALHPPPGPGGDRVGDPGLHAAPLARAEPGPGPPPQRQR